MSTLLALHYVGENNIGQLVKFCKNKVQQQPELLELVDFYGNTALLKACYQSKYEAARVLIHYGANIRAVNHYGQNALSLATYAGDLKVIELLLRHCTYDEFNKTSLIPAKCVATLRSNWKLFNYFRQFERHGSAEVKTTHGLDCNDIMTYMQILNPTK